MTTELMSIFQTFVPQYIKYLALPGFRKALVDAVNFFIYDRLWASITPHTPHNTIKRVSLETLGCLVYGIKW